MRITQVIGDVAEILDMVKAEYTVEETLHADSIEAAAQFRNEFKLLVCYGFEQSRAKAESLLRRCGYETVIFWCRYEDLA